MFRMTTRDTLRKNCLSDLRMGMWTQVNGVCMSTEENRCRDSGRKVKWPVYVMFLIKLYVTSNGWRKGVKKMERIMTV